MHTKLLLILLLFSTLSIGQATKSLDSLLLSLDTEKIDSNKLNTLQTIGEYYLDNNLSKAISYFEKVETIAKKIQSKNKLANIYSKIGSCYLRKNDFDHSLNFYKQAEKILESLNDQQQLTATYISISNIFFWNKDYKKATDYYQLAEANAQHRKDSLQISSVFSQRGMIYAETGNYDSALVYFIKAANISRLIHDPIFLNKLSNIGTTYKLKKNTDLALKYYDSVLNGYLANPNSRLLDFASVFNNIAAAQSQKGNYTEASKAFEKSNNFATKANIPYILMENYQNMAAMFSSMKDFKQQNIYLTKYYQLKDSLFNIDNKNQLTQLETDYQLEKNNRLLQIQETETNKNKQQRNFLLLIAFATIISTAGLIFFNKRIKQKNDLLQIQNTQIGKQKDELQNLNHVKDRLFSVISHDLRNPLVTLQAYLSLSDNNNLSTEKQQQFKNQTSEAVRQTSNMLDNLLTWANMQIKNTAPVFVSVDIAELIDDVLAVVKPQAQQKNISIQKHIGILKITTDKNMLEIALRNILTNAIKFSHINSDVIVNTGINGDQSFISVRDFGVGMPQSQIEKFINNQSESSIGTSGEKGTGLGLLLTKELLQKINAHFQINSEDGKGCCCTISFQV